MVCGGFTALPITVVYAQSCAYISITKNYTYIKMANKNTKYKMENKSENLEQPPPFCKAGVIGSKIYGL